MSDTGETGSSPDVPAELIAQLKLLRQGAGLSLEALRAAPVVLDHLGLEDLEEALARLKVLIAGLGETREAIVLRSAMNVTGKLAKQPEARRKEMEDDYDKTGRTIINWENAAINDLAQAIVNGDRTLGNAIGEVIHVDVDRGYVKRLTYYKMYGFGGLTTRTVYRHENRDSLSRTVAHQIGPLAPVALEVEIHNHGESLKYIHYSAYDDLTAWSLGRAANYASYPAEEPTSRIRISSPSPNTFQVFFWKPS